MYEQKPNKKFFSKLNVQQASACEVYLKSELEWENNLVKVETHVQRPANGAHIDILHTLQAPLQAASLWSTSDLVGL